MISKLKKKKRMNFFFLFLKYFVGPNFFFLFFISNGKWMKNTNPATSERNLCFKSVKPRYQQHRSKNMPKTRLSTTKIPATPWVQPPPPTITFRDLPHRREARIHEHRYRRVAHCQMVALPQHTHHHQTTVNPSDR